MTDQALLERLAICEAKEQIREYIYLFCRALDRLDASLLKSLFHEDAELDYGSIYRGNLQGFVDVAMGFQGAMRDTQHQVSNCLIRVQGNEATAESYVVAYHVIQEGDTLMQLIVGARYLDRLRYQDGSWKFSYRREVLDWGRMLPINENWFEANTEMEKGRRGEQDPSYQFITSPQP